MPRPRTLTPAEQAQVLSLYGTRRWGIQRIAKALHVGWPQVRKVLTANNVPIRNRGREHSVTPGQSLRAAQLYAAGHSIRSVGAQLGISYGTARNVLLRAGVQLRTDLEGQLLYYRQTEQPRPEGTPPWTP